MYIKRAAEELVRRYSGHFRVVVVTGPRQVGKTTMLKHLMEEVAADDAPPELAAFKREVGCGCVLCLADDTFPVGSRARALPVWAV